MKEQCIFRVQFAGDMWRVMESIKPGVAGTYQYRIMNKRKVMNRFCSTSGQMAIELCLKYAIGCDVNVYWGCVL